MKKGLVGKKLGMTQLFDQNGNVVPVTVVEVGPCVVTQKKTMERDGYEAVQIGYGDLKANKVNKPMKGHFAKGDVAPKRVLREFRLEDCEPRYRPCSPPRRLHGRLFFSLPRMEGQEDGRPSGRRARNRPEFGRSQG